MDIKILFKDATEIDFKQDSRPGGSYSNSVKYEPGFVVVKDVWGNTRAFPVDLIKEVITTPDPREAGQW